MSLLNTTIILLSAVMTVFCEAAFDGTRNLLGAQIDLLPVLMVYASLTCGWSAIALLAIVGGLCYDTLSANPLGITILPLFIVGYAIRFRRELILGGELVAQLALGLLASAVVPLLTLLMLSGTRVQPALSWSTITQWIVMSLGGALATPVCFAALNYVKRALNYVPASETSFRPDREIRRGRN